MYFSKILVSDIIKYATSKGADQDSLCQILDVDLNPIDSRDTVTYDKMVKVLNIAGQAINDEFLGLHMGEQLMLHATRQVDEIMHTSSTIKEAFDNAINYSGLISDALQGSLDQTNNYSKVIFEVNPNWSVLQNQAVQQIIDLTLVCTSKSIYGLTGRKHPPMEVHFPYASSKKRNEYYRIFDCSLKFNEPHAAIVFRNPILQLAVPSNNLSLLAHLKQSGDDELGKLHAEHSLILEIKKIILLNLPERSALRSVALALQVSPRTLQRKLKGLNTNFKEIEKEILVKLSKKLILFEQRTIEEISYLLGFSEASAFIRFFKTETNTSPRKYRNSLTHS